MEKIKNLTIEIAPISSNLPQLSDILIEKRNKPPFVPPHKLKNNLPKRISPLDPPFDRLRPDKDRGQFHPQYR